MKILHYTLGFYPQRTGGLVNYVNDLMIEQEKQKHDVFAFYPANQIIFKRDPFLKYEKSFNGIKVYKLYNSLPLPLFGGIANPSDFMRICSNRGYVDFLTELKPEVIHIHSLIGLHKEFFEVARDLRIPIVFTSHDYYGLAPVPHFYYNGLSFDKVNDNDAWNVMSADALSTQKLRVFQNKFYPTIRSILKKLNQNPKHRQYQEIELIRKDEDYSLLRRYYQEIFSLISIFHFNSRLAEQVYQCNLPFKLNSRIISITNGTIKKHVRGIRNRSKMNIAYIGPDEEYKGYFDFLNFIMKLDLNLFEVYTYGHVPNDIAPDFVIQKGRFEQGDAEEVYSNIDILVVPSRWKETFGLVVLEALSYGITIYVSENVGAKDLLPDEFIFENMDEIVASAHKRNLEETLIKEIASHAKEMIGLYEII